MLNMFRTLIYPSSGVCDYSVGITTLVVLFLVRCVLEFRCGWVGVVSVLQAEACNTDTTPNQPHRNSNTHRTKNNTTNVVIQQNSHKLLMMDILMFEACWAHKKWNKIVTTSWSVILQLVSSYLSVFPSVCPQFTTRFPLDGFSWKFILQYFFENPSIKFNFH